MITAAPTVYSQCGLRLRSEVEVAQMLGVFGAPSFTTADGELFWGNDRLEQALAWAKRIG